MAYNTAPIKHKPKGYPMTDPVLTVQLLGGLNLAYADLPVDGVSSARLQSLLAFLILHADTPQSRQHVAFLFWPDTTESQARNNLRQFLYQLRRTLPNSDRFLKADTNTIYWQTDETQNIDIRCFDEALKEADVAKQQGDLQGARQRLERACSYYQGDLLPGCYDEWIKPEREHLRQRYYSACQKLMQLLEAQRDYAAALQVAQHLTRLDPLDESAYVSLMRLYGLNDDRAGARRIYRTAVETLRRELDVEPGQPLRTAYERLRQPRVTSRLEPDGSAGSGAFMLVGRQPEWQQLQTACGSVPPAARPICSSSAARRASVKRVWPKKYSGGPRVRASPPPTLVPMALKGAYPWPPLPTGCEAAPCAPIWPRSMRCG